jgi:hypothetical protein
VGDEEDEDAEGQEDEMGEEIEDNFERRKAMARAVRTKNDARAVQTGVIYGKFCTECGEVELLTNRTRAYIRTSSHTRTHARIHTPTHTHAHTRT